LGISPPGDYQALRHKPLSPVALAWQDICQGLAYWPLWHALARQDIRLRYHGSILGPVWLTLSMAIVIAALGVLYGQLFGMELTTYLPYLSAGIPIWHLLSSIVNQGSQVFIGAGGVIKQIKLPYSVHVFQLVWRNFIAASHNMIVFIGVAILFKVTPTAATLLLLPGLLLTIFNSIWVTLLVGLLSARFRDVPQVVGNVMQVLFFATPVIWTPDRLGRHEALAHINPFYAFIDLLRAPMLGQAPQELSWLVALCVTVLGWAMTILLFVRFRARIPYWV
jgi:ABC-type polysaccharide/polyol phosphate export permease